MLRLAVGVRMYRLVEGCLKAGASKVAWPVYGAALKQIRATSDALKRKALFRMPRVYRDAVKFVVFLTLFCDTFVLGATSCISYCRASPTSLQLCSHTL